ncbi:pyruvate kinase [soil metagenome]
MRRRTKIVCTLGPAVDDRAKLAALVEAGMNVARLNCSHGDWEQKKRWIQWLRDDAPNVAILADLQGPKFRIGDLPSGQFQLRAGEHVSVGRDAQIPIAQEEILRAMAPGARLLLGDGEIELRVTEGTDQRFFCRVVTGGILKSHKGVTLVGRTFDVPALGDKDREDARIAAEEGCDYVALSYVKDADDIRELRALLDRFDPTIGICAKIETRAAVKNLNAILGPTDLVMVARGDMGLQMDLEDVPLSQKKIIAASNEAGLPVITATQMLESMITNPRPTRAEATDVYNAVEDGTDAVMLSGETAAGQYPIECVKTMARIAEAADREYDRGRVERTFSEKRKAGRVPQADAIAHTAADLARMTQADAIVTCSTSGQTARLVSKYRPRQPILCATPRIRTLRRLAVAWGVDSVLVPTPATQEEAMDHAISALRDRGRLRSGQEIIVTAGSPVGVPGNTNLILAIPVP